VLRVIQLNYLEDFYREKQMELLMLPVDHMKNYTQSNPVNIFEQLARPGPSALARPKLSQHKSEAALIDEFRRSQQIQGKVQKVKTQVDAPVEGEKGSTGGSVGGDETT